MFAGVMAVFVLGMLGYAAAQLRVGLRDLAYGFVLAREARRSEARGSASGGPVLVSGRARAARLLSPPAGGTRVVAWSARGAYGFGADSEKVPFVVELAGEHDVHVDAERLVLLASEATDMFGNRVRALEQDAQVVVYGLLVQDAGRACLRDVPGRGVVVAASRTAGLANLARGVMALVGLAIVAAVVVTAHLP